MSLSSLEQALFRQYVAHRLQLEVERLIPEYIHTNSFLIEDIEDKGYESVQEEYQLDCARLAFNWAPDAFGRS
jgi:hypothetical protein